MNIKEGRCSFQKLVLPNNTESEFDEIFEN